MYLLFLNYFFRFLQSLVLITLLATVIVMKWLMGIHCVHDGLCPQYICVCSCVHWRVCSCVHWRVCSCVHWHVCIVWVWVGVWTGVGGLACAHI